MYFVINVNQNSTDNNKKPYLSAEIFVYVRGDYRVQSITSSSRFQEVLVELSPLRDRFWLDVTHLLNPGKCGPLTLHS